MRIAVTVCLSALFALAPNASGQGSRGNGQAHDVIAQINEARKVAQRAVDQQRIVQAQMAALIDHPADTREMVESINRQQQLVLGTLDSLMPLLDEFQKSPNRVAERGVAGAKGLLERNQTPARAGYAQQMLAAGLDRWTQGDQAAASARLKDAELQYLRIQEALEDTVARLGGTAEAAKNSPIEEPLPAWKPTLEGSVVLPVKPAEGAIEGVVLDASTGKAVPNATVTLSRSGRFASLMAMLENLPQPQPIAPVTTDEAGRFSFRGLGADSYILNASKTGYTDSTTPTELHPRTNIQSLELQLKQN